MQFAFSLFSEKDMKKHLQVVGAILLKDGKVLAAKRGESKYAYVAHKYEFVGGKIEPGETPEDALVREVKEELCADIRAQLLFHFPHKRIFGRFARLDFAAYKFIFVRYVRIFALAPFCSQYFAVF